MSCRDIGSETIRTFLSLEAVPNRSYDHPWRRRLPETETRLCLLRPDILFQLQCGLLAATW